MKRNKPLPKDTAMRLSGAMQQALLGKIIKLYDGGEQTKTVKVTESMMQRQCAKVTKREYANFNFKKNK